MSPSASSSSDPLVSLAVASCAATAVFGGALAYVLYAQNQLAPPPATPDDDAEAPMDATAYPSGPLVVYYGSQTGTAESFAKTVCREAAPRGFRARAVDLEDLAGGDGGTPAGAKEHAEYFLRSRGGGGKGRARAVFLMATYGEGEPTDNAEVFMAALREAGAASAGEEEKKEERGGIFAGLEYAVFGLGNVQYEQYNAVGKLTDAGLETAGATRMAALGLGDDDDDLEGDFDAWRETVLWPALEKQAGTAPMDPAEAARAALPPCCYSAEYLGAADGGGAAADGGDDDDGAAPLASSRHYFDAVDCPVVASRELRSPDDPGSTLHLEFDVTPNVEYETADNLGILSVNPDQLVRKVAERMGYDPSALVRIGPGEGKAKKKKKKNDDGKGFRLPFPTPCTVAEILGRYCDLTGPPRRSDLKLLAQYATSDLDKTFLLRVSSREGRSEFKSKIAGAMLGLADVLDRCPSIHMPLEHFVAACPRLQPRYYTIASSSSVYPGTIHVTASVAATERPDGSVLGGVCTSYLAGGPESCRVFVRASAFRLPEDPAIPIIMIGPGTGVAPMRALLQERRHMRSIYLTPEGKNTLYFGCRDRRLDYLYRDEFEAAHADGTLDVLRTAFSREVPDKKVYVQHLLAEDGVEVWQAIEEEEAYVYVCGGVAMGRDVVRTLGEIVRGQGGKNEEEAATYVAEMQRGGRLVQELWA